MSEKDLVSSAERLSSYLDQRLSEFGNRFYGFEVVVEDKGSYVYARVIGATLQLGYSTKGGSHLRVDKGSPNYANVLHPDLFLLDLVQKFLVQLVKSSPNQEVIKAKYSIRNNTVSYIGGK